ncbi:putative peptide modification system cyclase [Luteimonas sp. 50]|uniref:Peptide modification system cyclase n=1 Tax=Cognatiluteimonas sedimenti TaxID=2927791 RepID=A0ABT0A5D1_9GAMM|nr:putative peptide modification system cyclase [Lysobacter sedimenti]MCJ0826184.1 putative peptide modification system cyclase [Lysobacter sedimenti]
MHAANDSIDRADPASATAPAPLATPQVRTLLLTDLCDSTSLVEKLGDNAAAELFRAHDRLVLELQQRWHGRLIDRSDGLLLLFERAIDGLGFALDYARGLRDLGDRTELKRHGVVMQARAGLHVGEVLTWRNSDEAVNVGAKPLEVEGLAKPMAGRLMTLARPGQILLSATAEPLAHRAARELGERGEQLLWKHWGRWRFKGVPQAQEIYEVGEPGIAPLHAPQQNRAKAWRDIPLWRQPAALAAELLLVAGLVGGGWFLTRPQPAIAFGERDWVVVGDLRNLTGDKLLDDTLDQAFRLSLAQSRYVNVLSDLKVRETLGNMQRKPGVPVDRAIGSEIALRDGARALLLPTVAEVGGRLRVSAEVIDPRTQTTVYAVSADGRGIGSALASIDDVTDQLREKLGEALESVQKTSVALPNVATPSLDALKAFAVARNVFNTTRDREQALGLYRRALQLDPEFALAHADMADLYSGLGELGPAAEERRKALAIPQRLSPQERARLELLQMQNDGPGIYFRKAQEYLALYPDDYRLLARLGTNQWHQLNDFRLAEATFRRSIKPQYERGDSARYSLGMMLLGQERYDQAMAEFERSRKAGFTGSSEMYARLFDARGQHAQADKAYLTGTNGRGGWQGEAAVVTGIDRGQWPRAATAAQDWLRQADAAGDAPESLRARVAVASVAVFAGQAEAGRRLQELLAAVQAKGAAADALYPAAATEVRLYAGVLAARMDDAAGVADALRQTRDSRVIRDYPTVAQLQQVLLAEQERLAGKPQAAVARLRPLVARETALVAAHWSLMRAELAAGNATGARAQRDWLATHRGRVFVESTTTDVLRFLNAAASAEALQQDAKSQAPAQPQETAKVGKA